MSVYLVQQCSVAIVRQQRCSSTFIDYKSGTDGFRVVIATLVQDSLAFVTHSGSPGRIEALMIHRPALVAHSPPAEPLNQISTGNHDTHHPIQPLARADEFTSKGVSLGHRARKPIKEKAGGAIGVLQPLGYHSRHEFIRNQFSFVHVGTGLLPEGRFLSRSLAQEVS